MILYHGSFVEVSKPDLRHSRPALDFGLGFYTTPIYNQAIKWSNRFKRRGQESIISCYTLNDEVLQDLKVLQFETYSEEWLDFILTCRREKDASNYDIVIGGVANDKVFNTVELYFDGLIDKNEAIKRLRFEKPNAQVCLRTEKALANLHFERSEKA